MSTQKNDGGPAFPTGFLTEGGNAGGLSMRDWFAGHESLAEWDRADGTMPTKMGELLAGEPMPSIGWENDPIAMLRWEAKWRAALKYIRADAMFAEKRRREAP